MVKKRKSRVKQAGLAPGSLVHTGEKKAERVQITVIDYDQSNYQCKHPAGVSACAAFKDTQTTTWIKITGLHEVNMIEKIGAQFNLHPLILEDVLHTTQRPKLEDHEEHLFVVLKLLSFNEQTQTVETEQFSIILGNRYIITFQESERETFEPLRERIKKANSRFRKMGVDYLLYALIDYIVDHYFIVLEKLDAQIEALQEQITDNPTEQTLHEIHQVKKEMVMLRKAFWPARDLAAELLRTDSPLIRPATEIYLKDIHDHIVRVIETADTLRDMIAGMLDVYLSIASNKMNAVMKVLTIIATIFIPLTFIAGVYGMNFKYMPELDYPWAYPVVWLIMIAAVIIMLAYFKKKKWL